MYCQLNFDPQKSTLSESRSPTFAFMQLTVTLIWLVLWFWIAICIVKFASSWWVFCAGYLITFADCVHLIHPTAKKKVVIRIPGCHIPVVYQSKIVISHSLWYWKYRLYNKKSRIPVHIPVFFVYRTYTKISKIWSDMLSHRQFFWSFWYTKHIPNLYHSYTELKLKKKYIPTHLPNEILKRKNLRYIYCVILFIAQISKS